MALSNQIGSYDDCFEYFQRALEDPVGIRIEFETHGKAQMFQLRMHNARSLERAESRRIYSRTDIQFDKSAYDKLTVRNPREDTKGRWWVFIERGFSKVGAIESLADYYDTEVPQIGEVQQLTYEEPSDDLA